jgi:beta-lactamase class A
MKKIVFGCTVLLAGGMLLGYMISNTRFAGSTPITAIVSDNYPLLAKRLFIEEPNDTIINFDELRQSIREYTTRNKLTGSTYFEYLPTGTSIRIDGDELEVAASLFKLPASMELYKAVELGKINLDQKVSLREDWLDSAYGTLYKKGSGYSLSIKELNDIMLKESDNTALKGIAFILNETNLAPELKPYNFLDIDYSQNPDLTVSISARGYSSFLKCLYFSCYVNKDSSQEILNTLTQSSFGSRIPAGVPDKNIKIAHKIGNFAQTTQSDCGIVFVPLRNYILCVMIDGPDSATTDAHIAEISQLAYSFVAGRP